MRLKRLWLPILAALGITSALFASWDKTKPAAGTPMVSSEIRANWAALETQVAGLNLMADPVFLMWSQGDALSPDHYTLSGASAAVARAGTGLGDTNRKVGDFCAKVTSGGAAVSVFQQQLLPTAAMTKASPWIAGMDVSAGAYVRAATASVIRIGINDGVTTTYSSFHTGGSTWQWLTVTKTLNASPTALIFRMENNAGTNVGYLSGPTFVLGSVPPATYAPAPLKPAVPYTLTVSGNCATGTSKGAARFVFQRPTIITNTMLTVGTAPATQAWIVDINNSLTTMYTTKPQVAATATFGQAAPDGTYSQRCFPGGTGNPLTIDFDQCGTGTVGADMTVHVFYLQWARPLEAFLAPADQN